MSILCHRRPSLVARRLAVSVPLLFIAFGSHAQSRLDPVVVTGSREPQLQSRSAADIVVVDAEAIRASGVDTVEELLRRFAGVQLARNGGPGQTSGYFVRGASTSGTLVLIDGVRIGSASLGQASFESLSPAQIERIEVLRGPASSLYGADAVGGVVQLFTRQGAGAPRVVAGAAVGRYRSAEGDAGVSGSQGAFDYAVAAGHERSRGVSARRPGDAFGNFNEDADGFRRSWANVKLGVAPAAGHRIGVTVVASRLNAQYDGSEFLPPTFAQDATPDFRNRLRTTLASLDYRGEVGRAWTTTWRLARSVDDATSGGTDLSRFRTTREQATWQNAIVVGDAQRVVVAYEHLREKVGGDVFAAEPRRRNHGLVVGYAGGFGPVGVEASLRRDANSVYGGHTTGGVGATVAVAPGLTLRALAGTTFRAPTFNDLFFPGFGIASGPFAIRAERGFSVELGVAWQSATTRAWAGVYNNRVKDLIGFQPDRAFCPADPAYDFGCAGNVSRAVIEGATLGAARRWGGLELQASVDLLDAKDADTGQRLPRRAAHQESVAADYTAGRWSVGASLLRVGSRPDGGVVLGGYALLDLRAGWRFAPRWRLEAKLLNALDRDVEPLRDYRGLGRQGWLGVRYDSAGL